MSTYTGMLERLSSFVHENYGLQGNYSPLPGDVDFNYLLKSGQNNYLVKVVRPENKSSADFQSRLIDALGNYSYPFPIQIKTTSGNLYSSMKYKDTTHVVRVLSWLEGEVWNQKKDILPDDYRQLGMELGKVDAILAAIELDNPPLNSEWDSMHASWIDEKLHLFPEGKSALVSYFFKEYKAIKDELVLLPQQLIHNDANDFNILVDKDGRIKLIDYGDSLYSARIIEIANSVAYVAMDRPDPTSIAALIVGGYHEVNALTKEEIIVLYNLVAIRLLLSVTHSTINAVAHPENEYHQISSKPAWNLLKKWKDINKTYFTYRMEAAAEIEGTLHEKHQAFIKYTDGHRVHLKDLLPYTESLTGIHMPLDVSQSHMGTSEDYNNPIAQEHIINRFCRRNGADYTYNGYQECRPFYVTDAFAMERNTAVEFRTIHLGEDYWIPAGEEVRTLIDGAVVVIEEVEDYKDYGNVVVLRHEEEGIEFYTLYGHLAKECHGRLNVGAQVNAGGIIGYIGDPEENGSWMPHLHFQIMLSMCGYKNNFPGVTYPSEKELWKKLCPDPKLWMDGIQPYTRETDADNYTVIAEKRSKMLGENLSLSYGTPEYMVRGRDQYLLNRDGQRFLDLVNNVAHVGHENPGVVEAGRNQMATLNTNTRYLHPSIVTYAESLLATFPDKLSRVYFTNSGSEATDLALRMARVATGHSRAIAMEMGYHGHTQSAIDVSSYKFNRNGGAGKPESTSLMSLPDTIRKHSKYGDNYMLEIDDILADHTTGPPACFISETIMSCGGQIELPSGYLEYVYHAVRKAGGLCIADEVQTGFGRVGSHFWAYELQGVVPDIVTLGKPMGNGHPLAAVICTEDVASSFHNGMEYFNTYAGNPVSCEIGLAVLNEIHDRGLQQRAHTLGKKLKEGLIELSERYDSIADVRGVGLFLGIEFSDGQEPLAQLAKDVVAYMKAYKILLSTDGPHDNVVKIKPPLVITASDVEKTLRYLSIVMERLS